MPYQTFINPRDIYYGPGALESLSKVTIKRALIVTDPGVRDLGLIDRVEKLIRLQDAEVAVFDQVEADPSRDTAYQIFLMAQDFKPDTFIGLGGGSSIDAGKAGWVFYEHPDLAEMPLLDVQVEVPKRSLRNKATYIAIPTTSGTGSEVTAVAVITDRDEKPPLKVGIATPQMKPDIAIADPELSASMPPAVTANTGFDALVHAIECYVLNPPSDMVDSLCIWPAKTIFEWLPEAVNNGQNMTARDKMHIAALQAGMAFGNGRLGIVHVLSHEISAIFRVPHGRANAFMLCPCFAFLFATHQARLSRLAELLGYKGDDDRAKVENLIIGLNELKASIGIPQAMNAEVEDTDFNAQLEPMLHSYSYYMGARLKGVSDENKRAGGWPVAIEEVKALYTHAFNGTRVAF
ncbi:iron-containing alcohol dehydrogenase [Thermodesulfobacteriota bacterium]